VEAAVSSGEDESGGGVAVVVVVEQVDQEVGWVHGADAGGVLGAPSGLAALIDFRAARLWSPPLRRLVTPQSWSSPTE
jgi:hypothetical protein